MEPLAGDPSPYGYTVSLVFFIIPTIVLAIWFLRHPAYPFQRKVFWSTIAVLVPMGFVLDILFGHQFFTFVNHEAVIGIMVPVVGGKVPVEEFIFYFFGFTTTLLFYIWCDEYWFGAYNVPDYKHEIEEQHIDHVVQLHWNSLIIGLVVFLLAWAYKYFVSSVPDGIPGYMAFILAVSVVPSMLFYRTTVEFINWRAFSFVFFLMILIPLMWEATLAIPYQWWGYHPEVMTGIFIDGWTNLPLEAAIVWLAVTYSTVIFYEMVKIFLTLRGKI